MVADTLVSTSLFNHHLLEVKKNEPLLHFTRYDYVIGFILLLAYILFVWLYATNRKRLNQTITGIFIYRPGNQSGRDENTVNNRITLFLFILFLLTSTSFIIQTGSYYHFIDKPAAAGTYIMTFLTICLIYSVKIIITKWMGLLFQTPKEAEDYTLNVFLFCNALGLFLLPIVICLTFVKQFPADLFIKVGFGIIVLFIGSRFIRGILIGFKSIRISKFYLFLYLCTLEIVPLVVITKLLILKFN